MSIKIKAINTLTRKFLSNECLQNIIRLDDQRQLRTPIYTDYIKLIYSTGAKDIYGDDVFEDDLVVFYHIVQREPAVIKINKYNEAYFKFEDDISFTPVSEYDGKFIVVGNENTTELLRIKNRSK